MGISLNGLTPAGTYPGLIKTGDNTAISGTPKVLSDGNGNNLPMEVSTTGVNFTNNLTQGGTALQPVLVSGTNIKTINGASLLGSGNIPVVTSPSGVAGAIQFSNGSAFASDASNLFWDDTNKRLGVGTNVPLDTINAKGVIRASRTDDTNSHLTMSAEGGFGRITAIGGIGVHLNEATTTVLQVLSGNVTIGNGTTGLGAKVGIKGSGSTNATTSLLVQNSAGQELLRIRDDGNLDLSIGSISVPNASISAGRAFLTNISTSFLNTTSFASGTTFPRFGLTSDATVYLYSGGYNPTSGSTAFTVFNAQPTINQTGGANGITRGLYINPTLTAAADFRAIQTTAGKIIFGGLPTSSAGLVSGQLWNDAGTLKIA
jgi:hypothetical protein